MLALVSVTYLGKGSPAAVQLGDDVRFLLLFIATDDHQTIPYIQEIYNMMYTLYVIIQIDLTFSALGEFIKRPQSFITDLIAQPFSVDQAKDSFILGIINSSLPQQCDLTNTIQMYNCEYCGSKMYTDTDYCIYYEVHGIEYTRSSYANWRLCI